MNMAAGVKKEKRRRIKICRNTECRKVLGEWMLPEEAWCKDCMKLREKILGKNALDK